MDIKRVVTNERYNNKYVAVDNKIYTKERASQFFPEHINIIAKAFLNEYKSQEEILPIVVSKLPDKNIIIQTIEEEREKIYQMLNLKEVKEQKEKEKQAYKLFHYLAKRFNYDMMVQEEVNRATNTAKHDSYINVAKNRTAFLQDLYDYYKNETKERQKEDLKNFLLKQKEETQEVIDKANQERIKIDNNSLIYSIYKILIEKRGICGNIAYTYSYLLKGLNIDNYILSVKIKDEDAEYLHGFNLIETSANSKKYYYAADLTYANSIMNNSSKFLLDENKYHLQGFYLTAKDLNKMLKDYKILHLETTNDILKQKNDKELKAYIKHYNVDNNNKKVFEKQMITREKTILKLQENEKQF